MLNFKAYSLEAYTLPVWEGDTVYNESVMFVGEREAPLLYQPDRVIAVLSSDLKTQYREGEDYTVQDGRLCLTRHSAIPVFPLSEYYPDILREGFSFPTTVEGFQNIRYGESDTFSKMQLSVTYTHSDLWQGRIPPRSQKLHRFVEKAASGQPVTVLFYGDSITTGCNSSKMVGFAPYAPCWYEMVMDKLIQHFHNPNIQWVNTALGGQNTQWALEQLHPRAIAIQPDLMVYAFGMNDGFRMADEFCRLTEQVLDRFTQACPDAEVAVVSTMLPHFRVGGFWGQQYTYEEGLYRLCEKYPQADVVPVTSIHKTLLEKKRYYDMTGNNVNHPNDFLARVYAQAIIRAILG